jgi:hypothetical protein
MTSCAGLCGVMFADTFNVSVPQVLWGPRPLCYGNTLYCTVQYIVSCGHCGSHKLVVSQLYLVRRCSKVLQGLLAMSWHVGLQHASYGCPRAPGPTFQSLTYGPMAMNPAGSAMHHGLHIPSK